MYFFHKNVKETLNFEKSLKIFTKSLKKRRTNKSEGKKFLLKSGRFFIKNWKKLKSYKLENKSKTNKNEKNEKFSKFIRH